QDQYPANYSDIYNFDLILCRNVFIYFSAAAIALVLEKFYNSLAIGGYLITGHTELYGQNTERFQVISYPESTVYQRPAATRSPTTLVPALLSTQVNPIPTSLRIASPAVNPIAASFTPVASSPAVLPSSLPSTQPSAQPSAHPGLNPLSELVALIQREAYSEAIDQAKQLISLEPNHFQAHCLLAESHANLGNYLTAIQVCQQALQINPLAVEPYYLLAQISEEQSDREGAKVFLKRIIYLDPTSVPAYLELGALYEQEGNLQKAKRIWQSALDLLILMTPETVVEPRQNLTVAQARITIEKNLQKK
ncbi:MAG TPA: tetratricopeptide repeat protein, partial [Allocoleopsis sp.]